MTARNTTSTQSLDSPVLNGYFRHKYGGLYQLVARTLDAGEPVAVYKHLWPFEEKEYTRPWTEFEERFMSISEQELQHAMSADRGHAQAQVALAKVTTQ